MNVAVEERSDIVSVDNTNFHAYVDEKLTPKGPELTPEESAAKELEKVETEKAERLAKEKAEEDPTHELDDTVPGEKKSRINERFSELTKARKAAEAKAEQVAQEAKEAREAAEAAARERDELRAKYEAPKAVPDAEPLVEHFASKEDFYKARDEWAADKARREDAAKAEERRQTQERDQIAKSWKERQDAFKKESPEYEEKIAKSAVKVSDQLMNAIVESEQGPRILEHLADNPEVAEEWGKLSVSKMLREFGKMEATIAAPKAAAKPVLKAVEISKAPEPIKPLKGADAPLTSLKGSDPVPKDWSYDDWKAAYEAGRIK